MTKAQMIEAIEKYVANTDSPEDVAYINYLKKQYKDSVYDAYNAYTVQTNMIPTAYNSPK